MLLSTVSTPSITRFVYRRIGPSLQLTQAVKTRICILLPERPPLPRLYRNLRLVTS